VTSLQIFLLPSTEESFPIFLIDKDVTANDQFTNLFGELASGMKRLDSLHMKQVQHEKNLKTIGSRINRIINAGYEKKYSNHQEMLILGMQLAINVKEILDDLDTIVMQQRFWIQRLTEIAGQHELLNKFSELLEDLAVQHVKKVTHYDELKKTMLDGIDIIEQRLNDLVKDESD
jgi:hypothetical protein